MITLDEWPCDRKVAHGSHNDCPGVLAHPRTMIAGGRITTSGNPIESTPEKAKEQELYIVMTQQEFDDLPEYSTGHPTGTTLGKRWRRFHSPSSSWMMGEYAESPDPKWVRVIWRWIKIIDPGWKPTPDCNDRCYGETCVHRPVEQHGTEADRG